MSNKLVECASTGTRMPESQAREVDGLCKTLPADCKYRTKAIVADDIQFEPKEQAEVSIISTNSVDKSNEVVIPEGVDLEVYRKNPVVLWNHDHERPIARCAWIKSYQDSIRAKTIYPEDGPELTKNAWLMTKSGILTAKSIGFIPRKTLREPTDEELTLHPDWKGAGVYDDTLLIEYSCCSIGMNNDALVQQVNSKSLDTAILVALGMEVPQVTETKAVAEPEAEATPVPEGMPLAEAIAYLARIKRKAKKPVDASKIVADILSGVNLDGDRIMRAAMERYKNRGRV